VLRAIRDHQVFLRRIVITGPSSKGHKYLRSDHPWQSHGPKAPAQFYSRRWRCPRQIRGRGPRLGCIGTVVANAGAAATYTRGLQRFGDTRRCTIAGRCKALGVEHLVRQHIGLAWKLGLIGRLTGRGDVCGRERQAGQQQKPKEGKALPAVSHRSWSLPGSRLRQATRGAGAHHCGTGKMGWSPPAGSRETPQFGKVFSNDMPAVLA